MGYITFDQLKSTVTKLKKYIDEHSGGGSSAVQSVNGKTGAVVLGASDVGALPDTYSAPVSSVNGKTGAVQLTASDVGAKPSSYTAPVSSVNGQTGAVQLSLGDSVSVTQKQTSGTNIADIEINGQTTQLFAPSGGSGGSTVSVTQKETSGTNIADITIDGQTTQLYAPSGGSSSPHPKTKTTSIKVVKTRLKNDATLYQPVFLEVTCEDGRTYACFAICNAEISATNTMTVHVRQLWGHIFKRTFGQAVGTSYEIIPLLTATYMTVLEQFTVTATAESTDWYTVDGDATLSQYIKGQYGVRSEEVQFT